MWAGVRGWSVTLMWVPQLVSSGWEDWWHLGAAALSSMSAGLGSAGAPACSLAGQRGFYIACTSAGLPGPGLSFT